jgi:hypothetical protein
MQKPKLNLFTHGITAQLIPTNGNYFDKYEHK